MMFMHHETLSWIGLVIHLQLSQKIDTDKDILHHFTYHNVGIYLPVRSLKYIDVLMWPKFHFHNPQSISFNTSS